MIKKILGNKKIYISLFFIFVFAAAGIFFWKWSWEKIVLSETVLKIGFITDWEYGKRDNVGSKLTRQAPEQMEKAVEHMNNEFRPDIVIAGGDMIESSGVKREKAKKQLEEINAIFSKIEARKEYVFGNHDLRSLSKEEARNVLGMADNHSYFDIGDWRFVLLDPNFKSEDESDFGPNQFVSVTMAKREFEWLEKALDTKKPTIIFCHYPLLTIPKEELTAESINLKSIKNEYEVRQFLQKYPNIVLVVSGHDTIFDMEKLDGKHQLIIENLVSSNALGAFGTIEAKYNKYTKNISFDIKQHGAAKKQFEINKKGADGKMKILWDYMKAEIF